MLLYKLGDFLMARRWNTLIAQCCYKQLEISSSWQLLQICYNNFRVCKVFIANSLFKHKILRICDKINVVFGKSETIFIREQLILHCDTIYSILRLIYWSLLFTNKWMWVITWTVLPDVHWIQDSTVFRYSTIWLPRFPRFEVRCITWMLPVPYFFWLLICNSYPIVLFCNYGNQKTGLELRIC